MFRKILALILILGVSPYAEAFVSAPAVPAKMDFCCGGKMADKTCGDCPASAAPIPSCCSKVLPAAWLPGSGTAMGSSCALIDYASGDFSFPVRSEQPSLPPPKSLPI